METIQDSTKSTIRPTSRQMNFQDAHFKIDELMRMFNGRIIRPTYKIMLLDEDETERMDITHDVISYDLSITYQTGQRRTLSITMANENNKWYPKFNTGLIEIGSKFRLDLGFTYNNTTYWHPMGVFLLKDPNMTRDSSNQTISFSLCDKFGLFDGTLSGKTGLRDIIPVGVSMYQAFVTIITADRGNGKPFDMKPIHFNGQYRNQNTYYTIKQEAGNTLSTMLTDLAATISSDVYYNEYGNMCVESNVNEFLSGNLPVVWHFTDDMRDKISYSLNENSTNIRNSVLVKGNIVNGYQFTGTAKNTNPLSPTCIQYRGELFEVISEQSLYSDELCRDRAQYELLNFTRGTSTLNISCPFLPIWDVNQAIICDFVADGITNSQFAIDSLSFNSGGTLSITASNINEVIF